jgi:crossover junction endodeoxyribonuclease RuvC
MIILGIDPGIGRTGWGVLIVNGAKEQVGDFGCIETFQTQSTEERLVLLYDAICSLLKEKQPDAVAIEELFFNTNVKTAMVVGQARGVILLAATQHNVPITVYTPLEVKMAVAGYGRADKAQVGQMVKSILRMSAIPKPDDTADALAIALTHAFSYKMKK